MSFAGATNEACAILDRGFATPRLSDKPVGNPIGQRRGTRHPIRKLGDAVAIDDFCSRPLGNFSPQIR